jgi:hypothetical protein
MNPHHRKHLRRALSLVRLDSHLITSDFLVMLLAQNGNDIECSTAGHSGRYQFDGLGPGASSCIVQEHVMAATGLGHELPLLCKWMI